MAEQDNILLEQLRVMRNENQEMRTVMRARFSRIEHRLNSVEIQVAGLRSDFAFFLGEHYSLEQRVERIERRLELRDDA